MKVLIQEKNLASYLPLVTAQRIVEKQQNRSGHYKDNTPSMKVNIQTNLKRLCADSTGGTRAEDKDINQSRELRSYKPSEIMSKACANENQLTTRKKNTNPVHPFCKEKGQSKIVHETTPSCAQNLDKEKTFDQKDSVSQSSDQVLKHLPHTVKNRKQVPETDPFTLCLDIIDREVGIQATDSCSRMLKYTCSVCLYSYVGGFSYIEPPLHLARARLARKNDAATGSFCTRLLGELDCRGEKTSSPELVA
uniref:Isoform 4 of Telomere repeats-binding bouquet formation protein 1 n=1 Tax=Mus musculus TaxID=10090 RepID=Q8C0V1-4|nr:Ccdc79 protein [Mus musculus]